MNILKNIVFATLIGLSCLSFNLAQAQSQVQSVKTRVVIQVSDSDPAKWNLALNNTKNLQQDLGNDVEIEIVAYGPGIGMLKLDSTVANRITELTKSGVQVSACANTMKNQQISKEDILPTVGIVKAGVVEIVKRQQEGWAYLQS